MPPIQIFNNAPLHPQGITPRTAAHDESQQNPPPTRTLAEPTASTSSPQPPAPQPGARPVQPLSSYAQPTGYAPPPPPQPGHYSPQPPKVTAIHTTTTTTLGGPVSPPRQMSLSSPSQNYAPTHSTQPLYQPQHSPLTSTFPLPTFAQAPAVQQPSPYEPALAAVGSRSNSVYSRYEPAPAAAGSRSNSVYSRSGSVSEGAVRHSLEHPPGYVQNPYAADGTAEERARWAEMARRESVDKGVMGSFRNVFGSVGDGLKKGEESAWKWFGKS